MLTHLGNTNITYRVAMNIIAVKPPHHEFTTLYLGIPQANHLVFLHLIQVGTQVDCDGNVEDAFPIYFFPNSGPNT